MQFLHRELIRFSHTLRGLARALRYDHAMHIHLLLVLFAILISYLCWPLTPLQLALLILSLTLIFITELQNSAVETALNRLHPEMHPDIGASKDTAAAAVLVAGIFYAGVVLYIVIDNIAQIKAIFT